MHLPQDLVEVLAAFAAENVRFLVVGGHAVSLHARPRATKDIDLWVEPTKANIAKACQSLSKLGIPGDIVEALRSARTDEIIWFGRPPVRVDILLDLPGVKFAKSWPCRVAVIIEGVSIPFIGRDDLVANKIAVGRPQDLRDVKMLERSALLAKPELRTRPNKKR